MLDFRVVYCIKDHYTNDDKLRFIKGNYYNAKKFETHDTILVDYYDKSKFIAGSCMIFELVKPERSNEEYSKYRSEFGPFGTADAVYSYFTDHFISGKELRKLKLEKINNELLPRI